MCIKPLIDLDQAERQTCMGTTPLQAIRRFCVQCVGSVYEVKKCGGEKVLAGGDENGACWFFPFRLGRGRPSVKLIRKSCLECMGGSRKFVAECWTPDCSVWPYRMGKNPNLAGRGQSKEVLAMARKAKKRGSQQEVLLSDLTKAA